MCGCRNSLPTFSPTFSLFCVSVQTFQRVHDPAFLYKSHPSSPHRSYAHDEHDASSTFLCDPCQVHDAYVNAVDTIVWSEIEAVAMMTMMMIRIIMMIMIITMIMMIMRMQWMDRGAEKFV